MAYEFATADELDAATAEMLDKVDQEEPAMRERLLVLATEQRFEMTRWIAFTFPEADNTVILVPIRERPKRRRADA